MKNFFLILVVALAAVSCDKTTIQQTTDNITRADSLFTKANDGLKTLDSISKTINKSDGITRKVIIPEIEKQKKAIDSTIKSGGWKIDSINKEIEKITKNVKTGTEVVKTLDSAKNALNKGENPLVVLTKTADKILKQTKTTEQTPQPQPQPQVQPQVQPEKNPLVKNAKLEVQIENLSDSKAILRQRIRDNNADLVSENFSQNEGIQKEFITVKVPLQNFENLVSGISGLGEVRMKNTSTEGTDYVYGQMCDVEITLTQNEKIADIPPAKEEKTETFGDKSSGAFMSGFKVLGDGLLFLLPFWPLFLIVGLIWFFINRNRRKKEQRELERQQKLRRDHSFETAVKNDSPETTSDNTTENKGENDEPDYSKYLPKK